MVNTCGSALAFFVVMGLDFVFYSGRKIDVAGGSYWFHGEMGRYFFQTNQSST